MLWSWVRTSHPPNPVVGSPARLGLTGETDGRGSYDERSRLKLTVDGNRVGRTALAWGGGGGCLVQAYLVLDLMERAGIQPDLVTFNRLLEACSAAAETINAWEFGLRVLDEV